MILSNDSLVAFHYRSYGTFFLHKNRLHNIYRGFTHYKYYRALFSGIELKLKYCLQKKLHTLDVHRANGASFDIEFLVFQDNFM